VPSSVIFYCGSESPYGLAHLEPLLRCRRFDVRGVVLATPGRWQRFRERLSGVSEATPSGPRALAQSVRRLAGRAVRALFDGEALSPADPDQVVRLRCRAASIPVWTQDDANAPEAVAFVRQIGADVILSAAYPQIFRSEVLGAARTAAVNAHPSLLPRCRGAHPVFWAIASGETVTGVTLHRMTARLDAGDILVQLPVPLRPSDTYRTLYRTITEHVPESVERLGEVLERGAPGLPQDESRSTFFREDRDADHRISFVSQKSDQIRNLVRAADGRAFFEHAGQRCPVQACESLADTTPGSPGQVLERTADRVTIRAQQGVVILTRWGRRFHLRPRFAPGETLP
jgi:methionyl-tRNA formyltransferase